MRKDDKRYQETKAYYNIKLNYPSKMLPVELYKILAGMVETLQCYWSLSLLCRNSASGCQRYIYEASMRATISVQIAYNFTGHHGKDNWRYDHKPLPVTTNDLFDAVNRKHVGCDMKFDNQRCEQSRYYMEKSKVVLWDGPQEWEIYKRPFDCQL